jgi:NAD(P)H-dependent FMN reductase
VAEVLVVPCSIRPGGLSPRIARLVARACEDAGEHVSLWDLRLLPFHGWVATADYPPSVGEWREAVLNALAIIWVTPTYHNNLPGVAKSALDLLDARVMKGKLNGIVGASNLTGEPGAISLGNCVRFIGGLVPGPDLYVPHLKDVWPREQELPPDELVDKLRDWTGSFLSTVRRFMGVKTQA